MEINRAHGAVHLYNLNNSAHQQPPRQLFTGHAQVLALDIDDVPLSRLQPDRFGLANETAHSVVGIRSNEHSLAALFVWIDEGIAEPFTGKEADRMEMLGPLSSQNNHSVFGI